MAYATTQQNFSRVGQRQFRQTNPFAAAAMSGYPLHQWRGLGQDDGDGGGDGGAVDYGGGVSVVGSETGDVAVNENTGEVYQGSSSDSTAAAATLMASGWTGPDIQDTMTQTGLSEQQIAQYSEQGYTQDQLTQQVGTSGLTVGQLLGMGYTQSEISQMQASYAQAPTTPTATTTAAKPTAAAPSGGGTSAGAGGKSAGGGGQQQQQPQAITINIPAAATSSTASWLTGSTMLGGGIPNWVALGGMALLVAMVMRK